MLIIQFRTGGKIGDFIGPHGFLMDDLSEPHEGRLSEIALLNSETGEVDTFPNFEIYTWPTVVEPDGKRTWRLVINKKNWKILRAIIKPGDTIWLNDIVKIVVKEPIGYSHENGYVLGGRFITIIDITGKVHTIKFSNKDDYSAYIVKLGS